MLVHGLSQRAACVKYKLGCSGACGTAGVSAEISPAPAGAGHGVADLHEILEAEQKPPKTQRHTAKRIFERLKAEYGHLGGKTVVEDAVRARRQTHQEACLPLVHPAGEAQVDFVEATFRWGVPRTNDESFDSDWGYAVTPESHLLIGH